MNVPQSALPPSVWGSLRFGAAASLTCFSLLRTGKQHLTIAAAPTEVLGTASDRHI